MSKATRKPPAGLGASGRSLWRAVLADVEDGWTLDAREYDALERACHCADRIADLDAVVKADGVTVEGSKGQTVLHPCIAEIRMTELARLRLLSAIELVDPKAPAATGTPASERARKAAQARWARRERGEAMRRG